MTNNELQAIKDKKEKFIALRNEIVGNSCKVVAGRTKRYEQYISSNPEMKSDVNTPSIRTRVLQLLKNCNLNINEKGTNYIATLVTILYHERKLYRRKDIDTTDYFNLSDWNNDHYKMLGQPEIVKQEILSSLSVKSSENIDISDIIYNIADQYGYYGEDKYDKKRKSYTKK